MKLMVKKGATSRLVQFFIQDTSVTTGAGLTGLSAASSSLVAYYYREGNSVTTSVPLTNTTLGVFASGGIVQVDSTNMPGLYQVGIPDAALATGANSVVLMLKGATNMAPALAEFQLTDYDPAAIVSDVWARTMTDLSAVPAAQATAGDTLSWLLMLARNKRAQTSALETVYKDDGSTSMATSAKTDDGTTFTRAEYT